MTSSNILHPARLGCMDEEEVGEALGVVEKDQEAGEVGGGQALQPDILMFSFINILLFNLGKRMGKTK